MNQNYIHIDIITGIVLDACIKIHSAVGPGCFEKVYEETLNYELYERGLFVQRQSLIAHLLRKTSNNRCL
ncbi:MAG: GxxExxY protein [Flavitalea sp.]